VTRIKAHSTVVGWLARAELIVNLPYQMIKVSTERIDRMDEQRPGVKEQILRFEAAELPDCPNCKSADTASVQVGIIGRTIYIAAATTKFKLMPNRPVPGEYFCNHCTEFFDG
jgi:hypothetical protein